MTESTSTPKPLTDEEREAMTERYFTAWWSSATPAEIAASFLDVPRLLTTIDALTRRVAELSGIVVELGGVGALPLDDHIPGTGEEVAELEEKG